jgi:hypothetical protein
MSAEGEIKSIVDRAKADYVATDSTAKGADVLSRAALTGLLVLARQFDAIAERIDWTGQEVRTDPFDVHEDLVNLRGQIETLARALPNDRQADLIDHRGHIEMLAEGYKKDRHADMTELREQINKLAEALTTDRQAELVELRRQIKKLTKAIMKGRK